jgi:L-cysteate sulfo-lyase
MPNLSRILDGPQIWIKRDDLTGLAFGGSKARALEYTIADAIEKGADTLITIGSLQSNHARLTAAAARKMGLKAVLLLQGEKPKEYEGNLLLDHILGADIRFVKVRWRELSLRVKKVAKELQHEGRIPYILPAGGSSPIWTIGYVNLATELQNQAKNLGFKIDYIINATASGGTLTGLTVGNKLLNAKMKAIGIVGRDLVGILREWIWKRLNRKTLNIAINVCRIMNLKFTFKLEDFSFIYNLPEKNRILNTIMLVAQTEGVFLDPIYTGNAMTTLIDMIKQKKFDKKDKIVFIHTGGTPTLFVKSHTETYPFPNCLFSLYRKAGAIISSRNIAKKIISK